MSHKHRWTCLHAFQFNKCFLRTEVLGEPTLAQQNRHLESASSNEKASYSQLLRGLTVRWYLWLPFISCDGNNTIIISIEEYLLIQNRRAKVDGLADQQWVPVFRFISIWFYGDGLKRTEYNRTGLSIEVILANLTDGGILPNLTDGGIFPYLNIL